MDIKPIKPTMRCYMSKQSIARFCFLGGVLFVMVSLLPFPHKEADLTTKSDQSKPDKLRSSKTPAKDLNSKSKNAKPVVFEIEDKDKQPMPTGTDKTVQNKEQQPSKVKTETPKSTEVKQSEKKPESIDKSKINKSGDKETVVAKPTEIKSEDTSKTSKLQNSNIKEEKQSTVAKEDKSTKNSPVTGKQEVSDTVLKAKSSESTQVTDQKNQEIKIKPQEAPAPATLTDKDEKKSTNAGKQGVSDTALKVETSETIKLVDKAKQEATKQANEGPPKISQEKSIGQPKIKTDKPVAQKDIASSVVNRPNQRKVQSISYDNTVSKQKETTKMDDAKIETPESNNTKYHSAKMLASENTKLGPVVIPEPAILMSMKKSELEELYFLYIENLQTHCIRQRHVGNQKLGGYHICEDVMNLQPCLVYSFGSLYDKDSTFEEQMAQRYGCEVHAFGKTLEKGAIFSPNVNYHDWKIGEKDLPRDNVSTLATLKAKYGHQQRRINILQMNIDYKEWAVLDEISNGNELNSVSLLLVEFHLCSDDCKDLKVTGQEMYVQYLTLLKRLYNMGFRIYFFKMWPSCAYYVDKNTRIACHDIHMIRQP